MCAVRIEEMYFTHLRRRILKIEPFVAYINIDDDNDKPITLVVDISGLTLTKKGDYIEQKWISKRKEFGFISQSMLNQRRSYQSELLLSLSAADKISILENIIKTNLNIWLIQQNDAKPSLYELH
jgi:hypothetical protein